MKAGGIDAGEMTKHLLLPSGEGGAKRRMRVRASIKVDRHSDPHPNPSPEGRGAERLERE